MSKQMVRGVCVGDRFGKLTVEAELPRSKHGHRRFLCRCDCGKAANVEGCSLSSGRSYRCRWCSHARHGCSRVGQRRSEYEAWMSMKSRCSGRYKQYRKHYTERNIRVCQRWLDSFEAFLADVGTRPGPGYSLDRYPDGDGDYEPGNVRWATAQQQVDNSRLPRMLTANGRTMCVSHWAREIGMTDTGIRYRLARGMSPEDAVSKPPQKTGRRCHEAIS